jgi:UPF0755 protein
LRRALLAGLVLVGLAGAAAGAGLVWLRSALAPVAEHAEPIDFEVKRGASLKSVAATLSARGAIRSARAFEWLARWRELAGRLQAGEYELSGAMPAEEILTILAEGRVKTYEVAIPEGLTAREIAQRMAEAGIADAGAFLAVVHAPGSAARFGVEGPGLEGYLYPETYRFPRGLPAEAVVRVLVEHFHAAWAEVASAAAERDLSMRRAVTLASIVEKETGEASERPMIASVFHNRLARGMRLESDPTTIYGIPEFDGNLRRRDLENGNNPYNTYMIQGLPPGPIANPGADALRAVTSPAASSYLFFVSRNDGTHIFSRSYEEHERNVDRYQRKGRRSP